MRAATGEGLGSIRGPMRSAAQTVAREEGLPGITCTWATAGQAARRAFGAFFEPGRQVWFADITYSFYPVYCGLFGLDYREYRAGRLPAGADYAGSPGGVVLANPNAPTGLMLDNAQIESVVAANPGVVVLVDEAYAAFSGQTAAGLSAGIEPADRQNAKSHALAGLRVATAGTAAARRSDPPCQEFL